MTPENRREYRWEVELADSVGAASPYQFGFSLFKAPGAVSGTGSLAALLGHALSFQVAKGKLVLGQFQAIIAAELDGPRHRDLAVQIIGN